MRRSTLLVSILCLCGALLIVRYWWTARTDASGLTRPVPSPASASVAIDVGQTPALVGTARPTPLVATGAGDLARNSDASPVVPVLTTPGSKSAVAPTGPAISPPETDPIWLSQSELAALPPIPEAIRELAESSVSVALGDQENQADAVAVAAAYACASTGDEYYCDQAQGLIEEVSGTDVTGIKTLALNRNLAGYVVAADIIDYREPAFAAWLEEAIHGRTWNAWTDDWSVYRSAMEEPSNGGCHARAAVTAVALYTGDEELLEAVANRFHDWLGRSGADWLWDADESWWQSASDPSLYRGVNPAGATLVIDGEVRNVDGVLPEDMKRSGRPKYPFPKEGYVRECQQGMVATAWMLHRAGYQAFEWEGQAVLRSFRWFVEEAEGQYRGDDSGLPYLIRNIYGVNYTTQPARPGKNGLGFYEWTHRDGAAGVSTIGRTLE